MAKLFDHKIFNDEAFGRYVRSIPDVKRNKLLESGAISKNKDLKDALWNQTGSFYAVIPYKSHLGNTKPNNYNGVDDLSPDTTLTYSQGVFAYGRAQGWTEKDFSTDITGGVDFKAIVREGILKYWNNVDQDTLLSILKGIFSMTGAKNLEFVNAHTNDISVLEGENGKVSSTTLNNTVQKACGDNKGAFKLAIMHSAVSTNLENLNLLGHLKYTDAMGVERDLELNTWNGRIVIVDDSMPTEYVEGIPAVEAVEAVEAIGKEGDANYVPAVEAVEAVAAIEGYTKYTTYVLGDSAIALEPLPVDTAYEMERAPRKHGGETTLWSRKRNGVAVEGISWTNKAVSSLSPTDEEIANGSNWSLINDNNEVAANRTYISHKAVAISRIISRG